MAFSNDNSATERAILIGLAANSRLKPDVNDSLDELRLLAISSACKVIGRRIQVKNRPDPAFYIGKGLVLELKEKLEELIAGYQQEMENFIQYRQDLQEYLTVEEEEFDEEFDEDEFGAEPDVDAIQKLGKMLETVNARIQWLESLKGSPEDRARLSEATGIELTQEALDAIIEGAKSEGKFIEQQIKLLQEGTEAKIKSDPLFIAEAGDHSLTQVVNYGPSLLNLGSKNVSWVGY